MSQDRDWIGSGEASQILQVAPRTALKILDKAGVTSRRLESTGVYSGRTQFDRAAVERFASRIIRNSETN